MKTDINKVRCRKSYVAYLIKNKLHNVRKELKQLLILHLLEQIISKDPHKWLPPIQLKVIGNVLLLIIKS